MKNLKKNFGLVFVLATILISANIQAQKKAGDFRLGFGINGGIPTNSIFDFSLGADARLQYDMSLKTSLAFTTGYTHLFNKNSGDLGFVPAKLGFKAFIGNQFYILGETGAAFGTHKTMGTSFLWAPGIGIATKHIDISLRYEDYNKFNTSQVSLRLAYGFKI